ncbi:MAG: alpha/beta hydrolase [Rhodoplanes sp.]
MAKSPSSRTFVLVHGMWHGGWCWSRVAEVLRARGHKVTTPTQTGLGERKHLLSASITLDTFVADVVNHLEWEDLSEVVLVGHSFGGAPISGAADRAPERIAKLIYLDAAIMEDGETWFGLLPPDLVADRTKAAQDSSGGLSLPPAPPESFGVTHAGDAAWLARRLTPHPFATLITPLRLKHRCGNGLPAHFISCTAPAYRPTAICRDRAQDRGWPVSLLATGHDAMVSAAQATAAMLDALGREP